MRQPNYPHVPQTLGTPRAKPDGLTSEPWHMSGLGPCSLDNGSDSVELLHYAELPHVPRVFSFHVVQMFQDSSLKCLNCLGAGYGRHQRSC
jgi:hypothetical protein